MKYNNQRSQTINLDQIYTALKSKLEKRANLQTKMDAEWNKVRAGYNRKEELSRITKQIGAQTHEINKLISELCKFNKTHKAMNMANGYLQTEIKRVQRIIESWRKTISDVDRGYKYLIDSSGHTTTSTKESKAYLNSKINTLQKLQKWQNHVRRYIS